MLIKSRIKLLAGLMLSVGAGGCLDNNRVVWSATETIPESGWNSLDGREFAAFEKDSIPSGIYTPVLMLRYTEKFPYTSLRLEVEQALASGELRVDTITVDITTHSGKMKGEGQFGLYELTDTLPLRVRVEPDWEIAVRQIMPGESVKGINNIGILLLKR